MKTIIYAASDATIIEIDSAKFWNPLETFVQSGKAYRRLTPEYWAWFNHKFHIMEQALTNGKISESTFVEILNRISTLYNHALAHHGRDILKHAEATLDFKEYDKRLKSDINNEKQPTPPKSPSNPPRLVVSR